MKKSTLLMCALLASTMLAPARLHAQDLGAIVAASDRSDADRTNDKRRKPEQMLPFTGVKTGMTVLDVSAGGGYSTELMARAVGPTGKVYAQSGKTSDGFAARQKSPAMANVVAVVRPFDDPVPAEVHDLDLITFFFGYHDTTFMPVDRAKMNAALFKALKPGGTLVIADHSAKAGDGANVGKTMHRIEEATLREEVEKAGFKMVATADFLRNPADPRDKPVFKPDQPNDEFVLKFERPR